MAEGRPTRATMDRRAVAVSAVVAGTLSGLPSTIHAAVTGRHLLASTRAAGTLMPGRGRRPGVVAGAAVHVVMSAFWATVIATVSGRRRLGPLDGALAGLAIAALDLGLIARRFPAIKALPQVPQWLDHAAFGAVVAGTIEHLRQDGILSG